MRIHECLAAGGMEGEAVWLRIVKAIEEMQSNTDHLRRRAPIHSVLIKARLLEHAQKARRKRPESVFPEVW